MKLTATKIEALRWAARYSGRPPRTTPKTWRALEEAKLVRRHHGPRPINHRRKATVYYSITPAGKIVLAAFDLGERLARRTTSFCGHGSFAYDEDQGP